MQTLIDSKQAVLSGAAALAMLSAVACSDSSPGNAPTAASNPTSRGVAAATTAATAVATPPLTSTIAVRGAWARSTPGNPDENSGGYAVVTNNGKEPDRLVAVSVSPQVAATAELHRTVRNGDMMKMEAVAGFDVPANGTLTLEPGANHIMFLRVAAALGAGTRFPVALRFERAGELTVEFEVRDSAGMGTASMSGAAMPGPGGTPRATP